MRMHCKTLSVLVFILQVNYLLGAIVQLPNGQISGYESTTFQNTPYYAFAGIPYAAPPVGELRFKPPQPVADWDGVLDTTRWGSICYQTGSNSDTESEDCLFINIFTPDLPSEERNVSLPVMLYIHGGGFVNGAGEVGAELFLDNGVVLASINYRLGIFGFISTQDEVIPGNNGLKDQRFAIQWVHDNIHLFGGNPEQVTIFGQSAGSASVAYQLLNQDNDGLFQAAILESGSFLSPWAFQRNSKEIAFTTASFLNSTFANSNDSQALLDYLLTLDAKELDSAAEQYENYLPGPEHLEIIQGFYFAPVVEVKNPDAFLTRKMYGLLEAGNVVRVPILLGTTSEESYAFYQDEGSLSYNMAAYDQHLSWVVPDDMAIFDEDQRTEMGGLIREIYTGGEPFADHWGAGIRYSSDTSFTRSVIKTAELYSKVSETYYYIFSYDGVLAGGGTAVYDDAGTVGHTEDIPYLFCGGSECDPSNYAEADIVTRQRLIKIWTDFAKYKNPTPEPSELLQNLTWPLVSTDGGDFLYVDIGENLEIKNHPKEDTYAGWIKLYDSLNYNDFDTY